MGWMSSGSGGHLRGWGHSFLYLGENNASRFHFSFSGYIPQEQILVTEARVDSQCNGPLPLMIAVFFRGGSRGGQTC